MAPAIDPTSNASASDRVVITSWDYSLTEDDSVQALKLDGIPSRVLLATYALAGVSLFTLVLAGPLAIKIIAGCTLLGGMIGEAFARHVIAPMRRRRDYRRNELLHNEFTIEISDMDIRIFSRRTDATLTADRVVRWREGSDHILIYVTRRIYFTIPKRAAGTMPDLDALRARLRQYTRAVAR
jgi:hypothetical protein